MKTAGSGIVAVALKRAFRGGLPLMLAATWMAACSDSASSPAKVPLAITPATTATAAALASASANPPAKRSAIVTTDEEDAELRAIVDRVAKARGLERKRAVRFTTLDREELLAKTRKKVREELPPEVLSLQGEALRALGLIPTDFDLEEGLLMLVQSRVAGFYDPDDQTMYLLEDLPESQREETLSHELVHALQDQSFSIGPLLDYRPGEGDRMSALQMLIEGDAMSAGFDLSHQSAFSISADRLESAFETSTALSEVGVKTPPILIGSLVAPYTDGFRFVQALRSHGGFTQVNQAYREPPESTEQVLHSEKYFAKERAVPVAELPAKSLGEGFERKFSDVSGELGILLMLREWATRETAARAAAGWGGDRFSVFRKVSEGTQTTAVAYLMRMDTNPDAVELYDVLKDKFGKTCQERPTLGPVMVQLRHRDVLVVAGPYARTDGALKGAATCDDSKRWAREILTAIPR